MERFLLSFIFVFSFALPVFAQERVIEEVIVTSTKKEESVQDLPISIQALSGDDLDERQIFDVQSLSQNVPGFVHSKALGSGTSIFIRGFSLDWRCKYRKLNCSWKNIWTPRSSLP